MLHNHDISCSRVFVVGDIMLDQFYYGKVSRISPEAPVPIVKITEIINSLGGAGNVVNNISHLGASALLLSITGNDQNRSILEELLNKRSIPHSLFTTSYPTVTKVRVIGEHQQVVRLDLEEELEYDDALRKQFLQKIDELMPQSKSVVISDYGKNVCTPDICQYTIQKAASRKIPVIVDPKGDNWEKYRGATMITPNVKELGTVSGKAISNEDPPIEKYGTDVLKKYDLDHLLVTRSEKGMTLISKDEVRHIPTKAKEVLDVTGAGDTVVATMAVCLAAGIDVYTSTKISNIAAGIVVSKFGTSPIEFYELYHAANTIENSKLVTLDILHGIVQNAREKKKTIVFTNGCFDILHKGHTYYLKEAKKLGDILIVGLNSDSSVKKLKGDGRPVNSENDRAELLTSLESVDYVVLFSEETPRKLIETIRPDYLVKGGDYKPDEIAGHEFSKNVVIIPFLDGYSSSGYINSMKPKGR
jgi:D-beta-D-heptose 7-phosphate kinase/D-beta-D-heptose 1-phosphate adenosyltransferase